MTRTRHNTHYPPITDWDDAYDNVGHINQAQDYPPQWAKRAALFRTQMLQKQRAELNIAYGENERQRLDIFLPEHDIQGVYVFVHGGYWKAFDKSYWSWLAEQRVQTGWAVAIPGYTLAPQAQLSEITVEIAAAISYAAQRFAAPTALPIQLAGHSAGGTWSRACSAVIHH